MEIKVLENEKNKIVVEIIGEDHTLSNALRKELWNDKNVDVAGYNIEHHLISNPILVVDGKNPKKSLLDAVKRLKDKNSELKNKIKDLKL